MKKYIDIRSEYEYKLAIRELEKYAKINEFTAPYVVNYEGRTKVHIDIVGPFGVCFNIEGRCDLIKMLIDEINAKA